MFQPAVKLAFVQRYCNPAAGWTVFVDIDPSEEGRTGGARKSADSEARRFAMEASAAAVRETFSRLGVTVGGSRAGWASTVRMPVVDGDRDIVAYQPKARLMLVAEAEGVSSGQPETKIYKAAGQIVSAASTPTPPGWQRYLALAVHGAGLARHLERVRALSQLGVSAVVIAPDPGADTWVFGDPPPTVVDGA